MRNRIDSALSSVSNETNDYFKPQQQQQQQVTQRDK